MSKSSTEAFNTYLDTYLEPTVLVTILTAGTSYIGYLTERSYFDVFGININWLSFSPMYYFNVALFPLSIIFLLTYLSLRIKNKNIKFISGFLFSALLLYLGYINISVDQLPILGYFLVFLSLIIFLLFILLIVKNQFNDRNNRLFLSLLLFSLLLLSSSIIGRFQAIKFIQGEHQLKNYIRFEWETKPTLEIENLENLALIVYNNKNFYTFAKNKNENDNLKNFTIYIIPEEKVKMAVLKTKKLWN